MNRLPKVKKRILCYLGLSIAFILMGSSNNVPEIFAERIFKPIRGDSWSIQYCGIIILVLIYSCLKELNNIREGSLIRTPIRRFVVMIFLMWVFPVMWTNCIKFYKGFSSDLNSIYLDRNATSVAFIGSNESVTVSGTIKVVNCNKEIEKFYVSIKTPSLAGGINKDYITLDEEFTVHPKQEKTIDILKELKISNQSMYSSYNAAAFEYILFNEEGQTVFKGRDDEFRIDRMNIE